MQNSQQSSDQTSNLFWILVIVILLGLGAWWVWHSYIVRAIFELRRIEYVAAVGFQDVYILLARWFHLPMPSMHLTLEQWSEFMRLTPAADVSMEQVRKMSHDIGIWFTVPVSLVFLGLAYYLYFRHSAKRFTKEYSMKALQACGVKEWPQITPVTKEDLVTMDLDKGPWAMAQLPVQFAQKHGFVHVVIDKKGHKKWEVERVKAHRQFVLQAGPLYQGLDALPIHIKALVVIFTLRALHRRPDANKFIFQVAASATSGQLDFTGVEAQLNKLKDDEIFAYLERKHAYISTFMASLLELARTEGVMATAEVLWLKPLDRRLWYILNSVGRQVPFVEAAGPFAHWLAEKKLDRPLRIPMVDTAVSALQLALDDVLYIEEGEKWRFKEG